VAEMVWACLGTYNKTQLYFIESGTAISSGYYTENLTEPFIKDCILHLFPDAMKQKMIFHQDNTSSHIVKETLAYMKEHNIQIIISDE